MTSIPLVAAFIAGLVSFLSPCVLPIIPGFLAYLAGESSSDGGEKKRTPIFMASLFFVLGFSLVFALLGVLLNTILMHAGYMVQVWLSRAGGAVIIFFGLYLMGFFRIPFFEAGHTFRMKFRFHSRYVTSLFFGFAFAAGWTPCVGPVLGGILGLAASTPGVAFYLLLSYALGLGIPFLLVGFFVAQSSAFINKHIAATKYVAPVFGAILVALGILIFTNELARVANLGILNSILLR